MTEVSSIILWAGFICFPALNLVAVYTDVTRYQIPNWIPLSVFILFFPASIASGMAWIDIGYSLLCFLAVLAIGFVLFILRLFGGGDVKLIAAASLWIGWSLLPAYLFLTAIFGGILAIIILVFRKVGFFEKFTNTAWIAQLRDPQNGIPYALAICGAGLLLFRKIPIFQSLVGNF